MMQLIRTLELVGWDMDEYEFRPRSFDRNRAAMARAEIAQQQPLIGGSALCEEETILLRDAFAKQDSRTDLRAELNCLNWSLGVVDLRQLLSFQRRLSFHPTLPAMRVPERGDWAALMDIAFAVPKPAVYDAVHDISTNTITLRSSNPNLHLRVSAESASLITVHTQSPFFEVARYAGRWFLRDGYHRAFELLRAGISKLPAVIVEARTFEELGAAKPHFFCESVLLAERAPYVTDFLDPSMTIAYQRPQTITTLRITMHESIAIATDRDDSGEQT